MIGAAAIAVLLLSGCHKSQNQQAQDQTMAIDQGVTSNHIAGNADIETLPPDESSTTPSNQLQNGFDNPDVNDLGTTNS
jgi:hypothetical protein